MWVRRQSRVVLHPLGDLATKSHECLSIFLITCARGGRSLALGVCMWVRKNRFVLVCSPIGDLATKCHECLPIFSITCDSLLRWHILSDRA